MRKSAAVAILTSGLVIFSVAVIPSMAFADDDDDDSTSAVVPERPPHNDTDRKHRDLEERYGKEGHLIVPPLVIRPEKEGESLTVVPPTSSGSSQTVVPPKNQPVNPQKSSVGSGFVLTNPAAPGSVNKPAAPGQENPANLTSFDPEQNAPVEVKSIKVTNKTPADMFIESATAGLIAMGIGAIALGAIAGTRAIRRK